MALDQTNRNRMWTRRIHFTENQLSHELTEFSMALRAHECLTVLRARVCIHGNFKRMATVKVRAVNGLHLHFVCHSALYYMPSNKKCAQVQ